MSAEIVVIASDQELYNLTTKIIESEGYDIDVIHASLEKAVEKARALKQNGTKILVARGGTAAELIGAGLYLPIVQIPITEMDVVQLIADAKKTADRIAIIGFTNPLVKVATEIGKILDIEIMEYTVTSEQDVDIKVQKAIADGAQTIMGAKLVTEYAAKYKANSVLLKTPERIVRDSLKEAVEMLAEWYRQAEANMRQKTLLDAISRALISTDASGLVNDYNSLADEWFNLSSAAKRESFQQLLKSTPLLNETVSKTGEIVTIGDERFVCNSEPYVVETRYMGSIIMFQRFSRFQEEDSQARRNLGKRGLHAKYTFDDILTQDPCMVRCIETCKRYAPLDSTVLVCGESGTGKEMVAQSLHNASKRADMPFVAINCAALPENLLESELFGYAEGAFTGAKKGGKIGVIEMAHRGTLFLDEIGEISLAMQTRLLRVLEERQLIRIGDDKVINVDVRIICATHRNLKEMVQSGAFRSDFFYRINVLQILLPSLAKRPMDIALLANHFLGRISQKLQVPAASLSPEAVRVLESYPWPGNIRELRNVIERVTVNYYGRKVSGGEIAELLETYSPSEETTPIAHGHTSLKETEMAHIFQVLNKCGGNKQAACRELGISYATLWRKLKETGQTPNS